MSTATKERDTLGAVAHELGELTAMLEETGGEVTDDLLLGAFERLEGDFRSRVDRLLEYRADLLAKGAAIQARVKQLDELRGFYAAGAARIERTLLAAMVTASEELVEGEFGRAKLKVSRARVEAEDATKVPARWRRVKVERTLTGVQHENPVTAQALRAAGVTVAAIELDKRIALAEVTALAEVPDPATFKAQRRGSMVPLRIAYLEEGRDTGLDIVREWQIEIR